MNPDGSAVFGDDIAEFRIEKDYCDRMKCSPFPNFVEDFFDVRGLNKQIFIAFLASHNPKINNPATIERLSKQSEMKGFQIPDILAHKPNRKEFYEIKPNSDASIPKGIRKLLNLGAFFGIEGLPYVPGTSYPGSLPREIELTRFRPPPPFSKFEVLVLLKIQEHEDPDIPGLIIPGLIKYDLCLRSQLPVPVLVALAAFAILFLTKGRGLKDLPKGLPETAPI